MLSTQSSKKAILYIWLQAYTDLLTSIPKQNVTAIGGTFVDETPHYIRNNAVIGAALIVPFFAFVLSGLLQTKWFMNNAASTGISITCLLVLPILALILSVVSYVRWVLTKDAKSHETILKKVLVVRHMYPLMLVGAAGFLIVMFVLFHDSAHCLVSNPIHIAQNPSRTVQCVENGFLGGK